MAFNLSLVGVFLISFSLLAFEIALTRLLSVLYSYHFVFTVVSLAMMGHGLGAIYVLLRKKYTTSRTSSMRALAFHAGLCAFTIALSTVLVIQAGHYSVTLPFLALFLLPFFSGGVFFAVVFRTYSEFSSWVYGADLIGAGAGCIGIVFLLQILYGVQTVYVVALTAFIGAVALAVSANKDASADRKADQTGLGFFLKENAFHIFSGFFLVLFLTGSFTFGELKLIPTGLNPEKEIFEALRQGKIEQSRWSAFGQTDLISYPHISDRKDLYIDGTAGTPMYRFNGDYVSPNPGVADLKQGFPGFFPFRFLTQEEKDNALIIGPGGGRDILLASMGGIRKIEAVEVNPDFVQIVRDYSRFNGGIYTSQKNIHITIDEGRSYLRRQKQSYDLILLSLPATNTSRSREGFALTENFLLTLNAITDYLDHLTPEGRLVVVTHGEVEALRLLSVSLAALELNGTPTTDAMKHIYLVGDEQYPVFVLQKSPISPQLVPYMYQALQQLGYSPASSYFPYIRQYGAVNPALSALANNRKTIKDIIAMGMQMGYDFRPVSDNSPFFFKYEPGLPGAVESTLIISAVSLFVILTALYVSTFAKGQRNRSGNFLNPKSSNTHVLFYSILFVILGAGFMIVEISMTQMCFLFIGRPILSIAVMLFAILIGAGIGGFVSKRLKTGNFFKTLSILMLVVSIFLFCFTHVLPIVFDALLGSSLTIRVLTTVFFLTVLGVAMGFPFPVALHALCRHELNSFIPWMIGINGLSSVVGSALSIAIAIEIGIIQSLWTATGLYLLGFCIFYLAGRHQRSLSS